MATVSTQAQFRAALSSLDPEITLATNITLTTYSTISYAVTIRGATPSTSLFWGSPSASYPNMLVVSQTGELTLESVILDGQNRNGTLVRINGGKLIINEGAVLQNIITTTANNAVCIASNSSTVGGTLVMNSGKITGVNGEFAVFCAGGSVTMNNDAEISGNTASGIGVTQPYGGARGSLTMTGNSRIYGNRAEIQIVGGVVILKADMYMGTDDGDAPEIYDNRPIDGYTGGVLLTDDSTLTMGGEAKIWGNYTDFVGGGLMMQDSVATMRGNSSISENTCEGDYGGGGVRLLGGTRLILEDTAHISENSSTSYGGGVYMQAGAYFEMKGESRLFENSSVHGGGLFAAASTEALKSSLLIGSDNSSPQIYENTASGDGGGIYIKPHSELSLAGEARISGNTAERGKGIYKEGILNVSQSAQVLDGIFFEDMENAAVAAYRLAPPANICIAAELAGEGEHVKLKITESTEREQNTEGATALSAQEPVYTVNVPIIAENLTETAQMQLEASEYVSTPNVPLVIADKGADCLPLGEADRAAWHIPPEFGTGYDVILNEELNQVLIVNEIYEIGYCHLFGADNPNPGTYSKDSEFPITLLEPGERAGYSFDGWFNCAGQRMTEIPEGTEGDMALIALWKEIPVYSIKYCNLYGAANPNPKSYSKDSEFPIILLEPGKRAGYTFDGWYDYEGPVSEIPEGTTGDILLVAHWKEIPVYSIKYCNLCGADNPNPVSYSEESEFPIVLQEPSERSGYEFVGWYDCTGRHITEIPEGTTGDITLAAIWNKKTAQKLCLCFDGNAPCVFNVPEPIRAYPGAVTIPYSKPKRLYYRFVSWNTHADGTGENYEPGDKILLDTDMTLYAVWESNYCDECD